MENTNKILFICITMLILGLLGGWAIGSSTSTASKQTNTINTGGHMMPDGTMMDDTEMDMSSMMADMNAALVGKKGDAFDQEFLSEMIVHHQGAIDMAKLALTNAKHQELKTLADEIIKAQTTEIEQMKLWQKSWYNQ